LKKEFKESIKNYKVALKIVESSPEKNLQRKAQIATNIGKIYKSLKMKKEALSYLKEAMNAYTKMGKSSKSSRVQALNKLIEDVNKL